MGRRTTRRSTLPMSLFARHDNPYLKVDVLLLAVAPFRRHRTGGWPIRTHEPLDSIEIP